MSNADPKIQARSEKRILQITANPFPPEIRVLKEAISLARAGFQSAVLCPPVRDRPENELWRGVQIFRPASLAASAKKWDKLVHQSAFFSLAWYRAIREVIAQHRPHAIHIHDIWLGRTAFWARGREQKVVLDLHENMPAAVVEYLKGYRGLFKWFNAVFKNRWRVMAYERALLGQSDRVFVVVEEARQRVLENHPGLSADKVVNIENLESKEFLQSISVSTPATKSNQFSILYIGGFGPHRGLDTLVKAMKHVKEWKLNIRVSLVGARGGGEYLRMLLELIRNLDLESHVEVVDWVPAEQVLERIQQATIGTVPHHANPHTDNTIPHKLYQYMIAATPVLVSTSAPLARTVQAAKAGLIFAAGEELDCARKIRQLFESPEKLKEFGSNGFRYVMEDGHNWEDESAPVLVEAYDRLLECSAGAGAK